jgi:DNA-binding transcriptional MerR regulator/methylmalonyl-CoA mutase cobalamin-binding subunit
MMNEPHEPRLYTIGSAVSELKRHFPDVTHSSLRFLEREGLLEPVRTEGGHRKFRASDLERVRTIKEWQSQHLSLEEIRQRLANLKRIAGPGDLAERYLQTALVGRIDEAASILLNADEAGYSLLTLFQDVIAPALVRLGDQWHQGVVTVGQEHEVSELSRDLIAELTARHASPVSWGSSVLAACVADEMHELGLRMVVGLLRQRGIRVHFLGASVSPFFLVESTRMRVPSVVLLSVTLAENRPRLVEAVDALRSASLESQPAIVVGGHPGDVLSGSDAYADVNVLDHGSLERVTEKVMSLAT